MSNLTVVILAAGLGTRMKSRKAKVLHEAGGLSLVEHVVRSALSLTTRDRIAVVVGHQADQVRKVLADSGVGFALQTEQLGTGHALSMCRDVVPDLEGRLVVLYGDCPLLRPQTLQALIERHRTSGAAATVITTELPDATGYGRVIVDDHDNILAIVEQKVATAEQREIRLINSGIYCFEARLLWDHLPLVQPNPVSQEYYLTDIVEILNHRDYRVASFQHDVPEELLGINTRVELARVDGIFRERKCHELMLSGVTVVKPETVLIDADVTVGMDTVVEPFTHLLGRTSVGENSRIGAGSVVRDCVIGDGVEVSPYTVMTASTVESEVTIGPFARLRPDSHVERGAHIGNLVELKKTRLGAGAKAGHLAYLGDATIGPEVNIGAGTITCNYDGAKKHGTHIGEGAFVGSNSTLVAPVEVGDGAYIAAGSVITDPVPGDALGIGRGHQVNKEGWAKKRREANAGRER